MTPIRARFDGIQESIAPGLASFALWTIWEAIPGHPFGSTVSINTLTEAGYKPVEQKEQP